MSQAHTQAATESVSCWLRSGLNSQKVVVTSASMGAEVIGSGDADGVLHSFNCPATAFPTGPELELNLRPASLHLTAIFFRPSAWATSPSPISV